MIKNKKSCSYGYSKPKAQTLIKLMKITGMQNVYGEIIYAENSSGLWREMQGNSGKYGLYQERTDEIYTDYLWINCLTEHNEDILSKIIESKPEGIIFCFSDHPVTVSSDNKGAFLYAANKEPFVWDCVFEIGLDENYFSISFDAEKFSKKKFIPEIEKVLLEQDALSGRQRQDNDT